MCAPAIRCEDMYGNLYIYIYIYMLRFFSDDDQDDGPQDMEEPYVGSSSTDSD